MSPGPVRLLVSAGEISGDRLAAAFVRDLRVRSPDLLTAGCGGIRLAQAGTELWLDQGRINFVGWSGPARHLLRLWLDQRRFLAKATDWKPEAVLLVDSPGWNRPLLAWTIRRGIPVHWMAPPQLWAWKRRPADYLAGISVQPLFAFETHSLLDRGAKVRWHGLPRDAVPRSSADGPIALLPGTREALWRRHLPLFAQALRISGRSGAVAVPSSPSPQFVGICQTFGLVWEHASTLLSRASACIAVPGTGCLDAVRHGVPTLVAAAPGPLDSWLARRLLAPGSKVLPNRILERMLVEERYGMEASPATLASRLEATIARRQVFEDTVEELETRLGPRQEFPADPWN